MMIFINNFFLFFISFKSTKVRLKDMEDNYNKLNWEHEVFVQRFEAVIINNTYFLSF